MYIIANWKMNFDVREASAHAHDLRTATETARIREDIKVVVCPSYGALWSVAETLKSSSSFHVGAQDVFWREKGAYTGEMSASMLKALGCAFVLIGHSERRRYLHETDEMINQKMQAALAAELIPVLCVGETFEERSAGHTEIVIMRQVIEGLKGLPLPEKSKVIIAYEPVWVIGTGQTVEPAMVDRVAHVIRQSLIDLYPIEIVNDQTRIVYGGSVDEDNIAQYLGLSIISGALVGSASLSTEKFVNLLKRI